MEHLGTDPRVVYLKRQKGPGDERRIVARRRPSPRANRRGGDVERLSRSNLVTT